MAKHKSKGDVAWAVPGRKTPIAYSTVATKNLIVALAEEDDCTIQEVYDRILYDVEAKKVLEAYILKGHANIIAKDWFK